MHYLLIIIVYIGHIYKLCGLENHGFNRVDKSQHYL